MLIAVIFLSMFGTLIVMLTRKASHLRSQAVSQRVLLKAAQRPTAQSTLHGPRSGGPLHSSPPAVQYRILVSGILQRMF